MLSLVNVFSHILQAIKTCFSKLQRASNENLRSCTLAGAVSSQLSPAEKSWVMWAVALFLLGGNKGEKREKNEKREEACTGTLISSRPLLSASSSQVKAKENQKKPQHAWETNKLNNRLAHYFLEQNKQTIRNCHKIILSPYLKQKKNAIFNVVCFFSTFFISWSVIKELLFANKKSRDGKRKSRNETKDFQSWWLRKKPCHSQVQLLVPSAWDDWAAPGITKAMRC